MKIFGIPRLLLTARVDLYLQLDGAPIQNYRVVKDCLKVKRTFFYNPLIFWSPGFPNLTPLDSY